MNETAREGDSKVTRDKMYVAVRSQWIFIGHLINVPFNGGFLMFRTASTYEAELDTFSSVNFDKCRLLSPLI